MARKQVFPTLYHTGSPHEFRDLQKLADEFVNLINEMKLWIFDKEECLLGLVKQLTRILMITKLRTARDNPVFINLYTYL